MTRLVMRVFTALVVVVVVMFVTLYYMSHCGPRNPERVVKTTNQEELQQLSDRLAAHIQKLAGDIGERNVFKPDAYRRAADYVAGVFRGAGYEVDWERYEAERMTCANLIAARGGSTLSSQIIVVGAHYDSVRGSPGANDNGSAVAALLELARKFAGEKTMRTVRFVAFANEEPPFFLTDKMGSRVYATGCRERCDDIRAMISLETMGCYNSDPGSQRYPPLFNLFYPDCGNFIAFVGNIASRPLVSRAARVFRSHSNFPLETVAAPSFVPGVNWSDHDSFWREGWRAFMVTDTAPYRYPHYHEATDTPDRVDCDALARVTLGIEAVVRDLATGEEK
ncbi:MAG: M28 family peptidase [Verrucomicrobia bacterium]|nr:M28 family peptidase [Verrucomicrobiota bacterium]